MNNTKLRMRTLLLATAAVSLLIAGCKKDSAGTAQEVITRVVVHLTGVGSIFDAEFEAEDPDGDGIWNTIPAINIPANTVFDAHIHVYDSNGAIDDEIEAESDKHLFTYKVTGANLTVSDRNTDGNGDPFGVDSRWTTAAVSSGTVQIRLIHEPTDKNAADPGGEVDFDVTFPVAIQ